MPEGPAAEAMGVGHRYPGGRAVLRGVDLALARGAVTALVGANGSGKTTLLRVLAGVLAPEMGEVRVLGVARPAAARPRQARALRKLVGYVSQDPALDPDMTGREILSLLAALHGVPRPERGRRVAELAEAFGLASHLDDRVAGFSGGLRRRLHLAAGLVHDPELLLLDEPTAGLDPDGSAALWADLAQRAARGRAVAVVTHDLAAVARHACAVAILDRGQVVAAGAPAGLAAEHGDPGLAEVYRRHTGRDPAALKPPRGRRGGEAAP